MLRMEGATDAQAEATARLQIVESALANRDRQRGAVLNMLLTGRQEHTRRYAEAVATGAEIWRVRIGPVLERFPEDDRRALEAVGRLASDWRRDYADRQARLMAHPMALAAE